MRKRRTREHIIADMSANHVERHALLCGYSVERILHDYGVDLLLYTYNPEGEIENEMVKIQLKATDTPAVRENGRTVALNVRTSDIDYWLGERLPVMLILYDALAQIAYWLHVQDYFQKLNAYDPAQNEKTVTVYFSSTDVVDMHTMREFARIKSEVLFHWWRRTNHAD